MGRPKAIDSETRKRLLEGVGRGFRTGGYATGVDALAREAGLTSGAFYAYFDSKGDAFRQALVTGLEELGSGIATFQERLGPPWVNSFIDFYLTRLVKLPLCDACALPALTAEVMRADEGTREAYEGALLRVVERVAGGLEGDNRTERAWSLLAILSGAATMARAVKEPAVQEQLLEAARKAARAVAATAG
jgi:TetR/AcrR family transcriptional regulator, transcriptional repressor for nem operon